MNVNNKFIILNDEDRLYLIGFLMLMAFLSSCGGGSSSSAGDNNISNTSNSASSLLSVADELNSRSSSRVFNY